MEKIMTARRAALEDSDEEGGDDDGEDTDWNDETTMPDY